MDGLTLLGVFDNNLFIYQVLSNILIVRVSQVDKDQKTWNFNCKVHFSPDSSFIYLVNFLKFYVFFHRLVFTQLNMKVTAT